MENFEDLINCLHWGEDFEVDNIGAAFCEIEALSNALVNSFEYVDDGGHDSQSLALTLDEKIIKFKNFLDRLASERLKSQKTVQTGEIESRLVYLIPEDEQLKMLSATEKLADEIEEIKKKLLNLSAL